MVSTKQLEARLENLQKRLETLETTVAAKPGEAWRSIVGISQGDALDKEAARLGAAWRAKENKRK